MPQPLSSKHFRWDPAVASSLDNGLNEFFLWHGCPSSTGNLIAQGGFDERVASMKGLYGAGIYMTPQSCKAWRYARADGCPTPSSSASTGNVRRGASQRGCGKVPCECRSGEEDSRCLLLVRAILGHVHHARGSLRGIRRPPPRPGETDAVACDSVVALPGVARPGGLQNQHAEAVLFDRSQVYPEFIIRLVPRPKKQRTVSRTFHPVDVKSRKVP